MQNRILRFQRFCLVLVVSILFGRSHAKPVNSSSEEEDGPFTSSSLGTFTPASDVDNTAVWNILFHFEEIQLYSLQSNDSGESSSEYNPDVMKLIQRLETALFCTLSQLTANTTVNSSDIEERKDLPGVIHLAGDKRMVIVAMDNISYHVGIITKPNSQKDVPVLQVTKAVTPLSPEKEEEISRKVSELRFKSHPIVTVSQKDCSNYN